ncbi:MAG: tRNA lysidine(34) synthetase TilS [Spirochaetaceae bacterium]|jgi:tRNA(Ile)-lysidine synthase|nr:tRNA lysidine(34) synthetase TilS [Spirochaetaceae bacterium]
MPLTAAESIEKFKENLEALKLPQRGNCLVAWSGGLDSTMLIYLLRFHSSLKVHAAYYNHQLRPAEELQKELQFLKKQSKLWNIPLSIESAAPDQIKNKSRETSGSIEQWARNYRYAFLEQQTRVINGIGIFTGHHLDDQVETLLMNFFQGSSVAGLTGLSTYIHNQIPRYRPLLDFSREDLEKLSQEFSLQWSVDSSNESRDFLRNNIRHQLIPQIEKIFPSFRESICLGAEKNKFYHQWLTQQGNPWRCNQGIWSISKVKWSKLPEIIKLQSLYNMADDLLKDKEQGLRIPYRFFRPMVQQNDKKIIRHQGHGLLLRSRGSLLEFLADPGDAEPLIPQELYPGDCYTFPHLTLQILSKAEEPKDIPLDTSQGSVVIRSREPGDIYEKPGKLKKKLTQWPREKRDSIALLVQENRVLTILDRPLNEVVKDLESVKRLSKQALESENSAKSIIFLRIIGKTQV